MAMTAAERQKRHREKRKHAAELVSKGNYAERLHTIYTCYVQGFEQGQCDENKAMFIDMVLTDTWKFHGYSRLEFWWLLHDMLGLPCRDRKMLPEQAEPIHKGDNYLAMQNFLGNQAREERKAIKAEIAELKGERQQERDQLAYYKEQRKDYQARASVAYQEEIRREKSEAEKELADLQHEIQTNTVKLQRLCALIADLEDLAP